MGKRIYLTPNAIKLRTLIPVAVLELGHEYTNSLCFVDIRVFVEAFVDGLQTLT